MMETIKKFASVLAFLGVIAGYGIWVGTISNRVKVVESRLDKIEYNLDKKLDSLSTEVKVLTIDVAVMSSKIDQLKEGK